VTSKIHSCDLCGGTEAMRIEVAERYTDGQPLHTCCGCGLVYVKDRRTTEEVAENWNALYGDTYHPDSPAVKARHAYVAAFISNNLNLSYSKVIDIGAGDGGFIWELDKYDAEVYGIEPSENNCSMAYYDTFCGTVEEFVKEHPTKSFNVATILWTLENTADPNSMLL